MRVNYFMDYFYYSFLLLVDLFILRMWGYFVLGIGVDR